MERRWFAACFLSRWWALIALVLALVVFLASPSYARPKSSKPIIEEKDTDGSVDEWPVLMTQTTHGLCCGLPHYCHFGSRLDVGLFVRVDGKGHHASR